MKCLFSQQEPCFELIHSHRAWWLVGKLWVWLV